MAVKQTTIPDKNGNALELDDEQFRKLNALGKLVEATFKDIFKTKRVDFVLPFVLADKRYECVEPGSIIRPAGCVSNFTDLRRASDILEGAVLHVKQAADLDDDDMEVYSSTEQ